MSSDFSLHDKRNYPTVDVVAGYAAWAPLYDEMVPGRIDFPMLAALRTINWNRVDTVVDLACGTGRVAGWLTREKKISYIDGIDLSAEMLRVAEQKKIYRQLKCADLANTSLPAGDYALALCALALCHYGNLPAFYKEAARLVKPGGALIVIDYHPYFLLNGIPTHFPTPSGEIMAVKNFVHLFADHIGAAQAAGWHFSELHERIVDQQWVAEAEKFAAYLHKPVGFALVFCK